jgi:large subunit ribosomal protein L17
MRHNKSFNHLGRKAAHRGAMLSNMATSLILHKRISTTVAKAKALKTYVEPLITKSKVDSTHSRRVVFSYLQNKDGVNELFRDIAVKVANRPGGYTRILKTGNRVGDNAEMCIIELVDYNDNYTQQKESAEKSTSKRRRSSKKKTTDAVTTEAPAKEAVEPVKTPVVETPEAIAPEVDEKPVAEVKKEAQKEDKKEE